MGMEITRFRIRTALPNEMIEERAMVGFGRHRKNGSIEKEHEWKGEVPEITTPSEESNRERK
jgi:hypothetical protein